MAESYRCIVATPTRELFNGEIYYADVPGYAGHYGVLRGHESLVATNHQGGKLTLHGAESGERTINGEFKLYHAATLEELNGADDGPTVKSLGSAYPIPEADRKVEKTGTSRFYQLKIE